MTMLQKRGIVHFGKYEDISMLEADKIILKNIEKYVVTDNICNVGKWIAEAYFYNYLPTELSEIEGEGAFLYIPNDKVFSPGIHLFNIFTNVYKYKPNELFRASGCALIAGLYHNDYGEPQWSRPATREVCYRYYGE